MIAFSVAEFLPFSVLLKPHVAQPGPAAGNCVCTLLSSPQTRKVLGLCQTCTLKFLPFSVLLKQAVAVGKRLNLSEEVSTLLSSTQTVGGVIDSGRKFIKFLPFLVLLKPSHQLHGSRALSRFLPFLVLLKQRQLTP